MISVYPAFYKDFRCKADRCVHSCCMQNWDIDIDEATAMKYLVMTGEPGETIRTSMAGTKGNRRFIMKDGRCPLLQEDGLCRIIAETGEENLCDICAMHPRFFVENGNFELAGVGLACEESVELLLSNSTPLLFMEDSASPGINGGVSIHFLPRPGKRTVLRHRRRHDIRPAKHRLHLHRNCRIRRSP